MPKNPKGAASPPKKTPDAVTTGPPTFTIEPLENSVDFLLSAAEHLEGQPTPLNLKYGTLHLVAAVEILLKVRLGREHFTLVFADLRPREGKGEADQYQEGTFVSVTADEAMRRLRQVLRLNVPEAIPGFKPLQRRRNQLMHHGIDVAPQELQANAALVLNFALSFIDQHLRDEDGGLPKVVDDQMLAIRPRLENIDSLVSARLKSIEEERSPDAVVVQCTDCSQLTLELGEVCRCRFCLIDSSPEDAARAHVEDVLGISQYETVKHGGEFPLHHCPSCGQEALVEGAEDVIWGGKSDDPHEASSHAFWVCFAEPLALGWGELDHCIKCGEVTNTGADGSMICEACYGEWKVPD